ncbi:unnamed protein product [Rotaria sp. Silwood1]|nr:unnamed protein product [Rotaria sp. Silwood1]
MSLDDSFQIKLDMAKRNHADLDEKLGELFIWKEQLKKKVLENLSSEQLKAITMQKIEQNKFEYEKLKRQKLERERQQEQIKNEKDMLKRHKEVEQYHQWKKTRRVEKLHKNLHYFDEQYWRDIQTITKDEITKLKQCLSNNDHQINNRSEGIDSATMINVIETLKHKTTQQLEELEQSIRKKIENEKTINISYWEFSLSQLVIYSARSRLHDRHKLQLKRKLQQIKQEQNISSNHQSTNKESEMKSFEDSENECLYAYEQAHYSPILTHINEFDIEIQKMCVDDMDDVEKLKQQRQSVMKSKSMQTNIGNISQGFVQNPNDLEAGSDTIIDTVPVDMQYL